MRHGGLRHELVALCSSPSFRFWHLNQQRELYAAGVHRSKVSKFGMSLKPPERVLLCAIGSMSLMPEGLYPFAPG